MNDVEKALGIVNTRTYATDRPLPPEAVLANEVIRLQTIVGGLLQWNINSFEDYNPGPNSDSHDTRWVCPVCHTLDEHEEDCPVALAIAGIA